jgi:hypothetical protein
MSVKMSRSEAMACLVDHALQPIPRAESLCRFCILLECQACPKVVDLRNVFLEKLLRTVPKMQRKIVDLDCISLLKAVIYERSTIVLLGNFMHDVLDVFYATHVYRRRDN